MDDFLPGRLSNKEAVLHLEAKPVFQTVASVTRPCLSIADVRYLNRYGVFHQGPFADSISQMEVEIKYVAPSRPTELFVKPSGRRCCGGWI